MSGQDAWWTDAVVYQVYPRSFQDSDGDGEGDLAGITDRLAHLEDLGVDALWLSPIYPSPMADGGYDVADYTDIDPRFGTLADLDALVDAAHERGLRVLLDVVPCHTSIEHPWFREHPQRYVWHDGTGPPNNWVATFGGPAWSRDARTGRWYLHSFYPEQPDLDWRNPEVHEAMARVLAFWRARGVDGFRLDAIDRLMKDPDLRDDPPRQGGAGLHEHPDSARLEHRHSRNAPDIGQALRSLRAGAGEDAFLVGEVYLRASEVRPYMAHVDVAFAFELLQSDWTVPALRAAIAGALDPGGPDGRLAWVLSNHDFPRLPDRVGPGALRAAAMLILTLPGVVFLYQGDELGMADGPGGDPPVDRYGRDAHRHPMVWDAEAPSGGFSTGTPWLPAVPVESGGVAQQRDAEDSMLALYRDLIAARPRLGPGLEFLDLAADVLAYRRGGRHVVAVNLGAHARRVVLSGTVVRATDARRHPAGARVDGVTLGPGEGLIVEG
ncbi:alpha-amylase family glycosyl hydrolase [Paraconexibacter sp.]|uniref:alpha-amylase family glycosyl hydrolase n=1 Tax=Paraconexibacter sp. TaxID=2949640 RepID=UPI0035663A6F